MSLRTDVSYGFREGTRFSFADILQPVLKKPVQLESAYQLFIGFYAHDGEIPFPVFRNENRFRVLMAERRNIVVIVSQVCAGSNIWHGKPSCQKIGKLYQNFFIWSRRDMDIQASEKRKFLERTREYVLYDILKQEDIDKIKSIYADALRREMKRIKEERDK